MDLFQKVISALVGLLIGTLLGNEISRFLYRPRVLIKFKQLTPLRNEDGFFWSIIVANYGRTAALNCIGTISLFDISADDILEPNEAVLDEALPKYEEEKIDLSFPRGQLITQSKFRYITNCSLCWSKLGNPNEITVNPGMTQALDICRVQSHKGKDFWYVVFPSERGWRKVRIRMKVSHIRGRILVCPANEFPSVLDFEIRQPPNREPVFVPRKVTFREKCSRILNRKKLYFEE